MLTHGKTQTCSGYCLLWDVCMSEPSRKKVGSMAAFTPLWSAGSFYGILAAQHSLLKPETPIFPCSPPSVSHPTKARDGSESVGKCWSSASELLIQKF